MKNLKVLIMLGVLCAFVAASSTGCEKGPAEKAGEKVDELVDSAKKAVDE
jgi:hypothetical protein